MAGQRASGYARDVLTLQDMRVTSYVELDRRTIMLTVIESWLVEDKRWFRVIRTQREFVKSYVLNIGVGRWLDGTRYVLKPDPRHFRLMEVWAAWIAEQKLDAFIEGDMPGDAPVSPRAPLPPVPVLAQRGPLRRLNS